MWRVLVGLVVVSVCLLTAACGSRGTGACVQGVLNAERDVGGEVKRRVVCVRLDVPGVFREPSGRAIGCFGLIFVVNEKWEMSERSVIELMAGGVGGDGGEIVARFRSVREARGLIASRFAFAGERVRFITARHEHDAVWSVREEPLPEGDQIMGDAKVWAETEIGSEDSGVGPSVRVVGLPPPLGDRGVAMVQRVTKGRALHWVPPRDQNASLSTSWGELIGWIERVREVEDFVVWNDGGLVREWAELRRRVDLREKMPMLGR